MKIECVEKRWGAGTMNKIRDDLRAKANQKCLDKQRKIKIENKEEKTELTN